MRPLAGLFAVFALTAGVASAAQGGASPQAQDKTAIAALHTLVALVGSCYAKTNDYAKCTTASQLAGQPAHKLKIVVVAGTPKARSGAVAVTISSPTAFWAVAASTSGERFELHVAPNGFVAQLCSPRNHGLCPSKGTFNSGTLNLIAGQRRRHEALMARYDSLAQSAVLGVARYVDACAAAGHTFDLCDTTQELLPYGATATLSLADGFPYRPGQVGITDTPTSYTLQIVSGGGTQYSLTRNAGGAALRTCSPLGSPSCSAPGTW
jgi:hypothetical protein